MGPMVTAKQWKTRIAGQETEAAGRVRTLGGLDLAEDETPCHPGAAMRRRPVRQKDADDHSIRSAVFTPLEAIPADAL